MRSVGCSLSQPAVLGKVSLLHGLAVRSQRRQGAAFLVMCSVRGVTQAACLSMTSPRPRQIETLLR
jgi:hypothetical protein